MTPKPDSYRPSIFIASSGKSKPLADAIKLNFDDEADVDVWTENVFQLNEGTLGTLLNRASYYDYFIAVFAADDTVTAGSFGHRLLQQFPGTRARCLCHRKNDRGNRKGCDRKSDQKIQAKNQRSYADHRNPGAPESNDAFQK